MTFQKSLLKKGFIFFGLLLLQAITLTCIAQKLIPDTVFIKFRPDTIIPVKGISIQQVDDNRNENPRFVRYETKNRFIIIPVDREVYTQEPLSDELIKGIQTNSNNRVKLLINDFEVIRKTGRFSSSLFLRADMEVYKFLADSLDYIGTYYYDQRYIPKKKKENLAESTENLLNQWHTEFKLDLHALKPDVTIKENRFEQNFFTDPSVKPLYMNTHVAAFVGYNWWGLKGEVYFSRPETSRNNRYTAVMVHYNNNAEYESFSVGKRSEHYSFRRGENWTFDVNMNFLIGFCKWKDVKKVDPKLYQVFDFELTSVQSIEYNKRNKSSLLLKAGLTENFLYVIERSPKFQVGLILGAGYKF